MKGLEIFHDQVLGNQEFLEFTKKNYGEKLEQAPIQEAGLIRSSVVVDGYPNIYIVSNQKDKATKLPLGSLGASELSWHTDMSYLSIPCTYSLLYAKAVPKNGGDTWFISMIRAWETLPQNLKDQIADKRIYHDSRWGPEGLLRAPGPEGVIHPAIVQLESGEVALYLGRRKDAYIEGLSTEASELLLDTLWDHSINSDIYKHHWNVGDLLVWDNRCTMHRRDAFDDDELRIMHRTQTLGTTAPVAPHSVLRE